MANIVMTTFGTRGNSVPFVRLGNELAARGHRVQLWTNAPYAKLFGQRFPVHALDTEEEYAAFLADGQLLNRPRSLPQMFQRHYLPRALGEFRSIEPHLRKGNTLVIAHDSPGIAARALAEKYRLPLISIMTFPSQITGASILQEIICDRIAPDIHRLRAQLGLTELSDLSGWWNSPNHYLALWPAWFAREPMPSVAKVSFIGFLYHDDPHAPLPRDCDAFLAAPGQKVLVTAGNGDFTGPGFLEPVFAATERLGIRALVVRRKPIATSAPNLLYKDEIPSLAAAMHRVDAIVHHGGMGTIGQALAAAKPQLVVADGGDRPENGFIIRSLGVGEILARKSWNSASIANALQMVLSSSAIAEAAQRCAANLDEPAGVAAACRIIEQIAQRTSIVETCAFVEQRKAGGMLAYNEMFSQLNALAELPPERRYLLAQAIKRRRPGLA